MTRTFVCYFRVSTQKQGLGLDAQRAAAEQYVERTGGEIIGMFSEKESGKCNTRPELQKAIQMAKDTHSTLLVAKLDRLSRDVAYLFDLRNKLTEAGVSIICADAPELVGDTMMLGVFASFAMRERELISQRTKAALAVRRAQGVRLGREPGCDTASARKASAAVRSAQAQAWNEQHCKTVTALYSSGVSLAEISRIFNSEGKRTPRGAQFTPTSIRRILIRCGALEK